MTTTAEATKGVPRIEGDPAPTARADHNALADWVRDNVDRSVANTGARDAIAKKWVGMVVETADTHTLWLCVNAAGSGTWRVVSEDTGWQTLAPNAGGGWSAATTIQYRRVNNVVFVRGQGSKSSGVVAADAMTAPLPAGCRPTVLEPIAAVHSNGLPCAAGVQSTGVISAYPAASGGTNAVIFHGSFIAEA